MHDGGKGSVGEKRSGGEKRQTLPEDFQRLFAPDAPYFPVLPRSPYRCLPLLRRNPTPPDAPYTNAVYQRRIPMRRTPTPYPNAVHRARRTSLPTLPDASRRLEVKGFCHPTLPDATRRRASLPTLSDAPQRLPLISGALRRRPTPPGDSRLLLMPRGNR